ncbi:MAG: acetyl-CoA carboxylase biotin carboxyl carrier protein [Sandaracinobacteroides sp.]
MAASKGEGSTEKGNDMRVELSLVRQLAALLDETNLTEIEVHDGDRAIRVARGGAAVAAAPAVAVSAVAAAPAAAVPTLMDHPGTVKSPMVGTAYLSAEPGAANYVAEGATVKEGDTLLIVEAMKVMNPIIAPKAGRVKAILVSNEQPVEYDQPLVIIE